MTVQLKISRQQQIRNQRRLVCRLAYQLAQAGMTSQQAMTWAWVTTKTTDNQSIHTLEKITWFAFHLHYHQLELTTEDAITYAKDYLHNNQTTLITFMKTNGTKTTRIVDMNWNNHYEPKGTGRPLKEGQLLMVDLAKKEAGLNGTISTYQNLIKRRI